MRLNLQASVAVRDSRPVEDPFGMGTVWTIRRIGHPAFIKAQKSNALKNPKLAKVARSSLAAPFAGLGPAEMKSALYKEFLDAKLDLEDLLNQASRNEDVATHLVETVEGLEEEVCSTCKKDACECEESVLVWAPVE